MDTMEETTGIPMMKSPANVMEAGPNGNNLASAATRAHPVDQLQRAEAESAGGFLDLDGVRRLYGSGLAMRLATERRMASQVGGRLPGLETPECNAMLDTLTGNDMKIDFGDYLSRSENAPEMGVSDPHAAMARKLRL
mmetsp:Transcript_20908/g.29057  ORF Transcript_20908/g.29057 Transcript_20908/m.29057 type:complete len:138 (-) Transcript_20908:211-624(-)